MKRVVLWVCALMMTLMASVCVAGTYSPYFTTEPPQEVREHVANRWPDYEFEDYCEVRGTPKGDYGFALVHRKSERRKKRIGSGISRADRFTTTACIFL